MEHKYFLLGHIAVMINNPADTKNNSNPRVYKHVMEFSAWKSYPAHYGIEDWMHTHAHYDTHNLLSCPVNQYTVLLQTLS